MDWITKLWLAQEKVNTNIDQAIYPYIIPDQVCGWVPWPERTGASLNQIPYFADKLSLRSLPGRPMPGDKDPNRRRIVIVGDSNVHGDETSFEDCWVTQLGHLVTDQFEVINAGVPGYGIDQAMWRCETLFEHLLPDIVVLSFAACDLTRQVNMLRLLRSSDTEVPFLKPIYVLENKELHKLPIPRATINSFAEAFSAIETVNLLARYDYFYPQEQKTPFYKVKMNRLVQLAIRYAISENSSTEVIKKALTALVTEQPVEITTKIMGKFVSWCSCRSVDPVIMLFPMQANFMKFNNYNLVNKYYRDILVERGVNVVDLKPKLIEKNFHDDKFWHKGGHLNAEGSRVFSLVLAKSLTGILQNDQAASERIE